MQNVVDDVSLRLTAAGLTPTDTVVLLRLDSGALERKVKYWMRSGTRSQCRFISSGVTPSVCLSVTYVLRRLLMCVHKELRCSICHAALVTLDNSESWQVDVFIPSDIYTMHLEPWPMFSVVFPLLVLSCSFLPSLSASTSYWTVQSNSSSST